MELRGQAALRSMLAPLTCAAVVSVVLAMSALGLLPSLDASSSALARAFAVYGLLVVFAAASVEHCVFVNLVFPGSLVILTAMALTAGDPVRGLQTAGAIASGAIGAQVLSYGVGRVVGDRKRGSRTGVESEMGLWVFVTTFWHPHHASITCYVAGVQAVPPALFLPRALCASLLWSTFWAVVMYTYGNIVPMSEGLVLLVYVQIALWAVSNYRAARRAAATGSSTDH